MTLKEELTESNRLLWQLVHALLGETVTGDVYHLAPQAAEVAKHLVEREAEGKAA